MAKKPLKVLKGTGGGLIEAKWDGKAVLLYFKVPGRAKYIARLLADRGVGVIWSATMEDPRQLTLIGRPTSGVDWAKWVAECGEAEDGDWRGAEVRYPGAPIMGSKYVWICRTCGPCKLSVSSSPDRGPPSCRTCGKRMKKEEGQPI